MFGLITGSGFYDIPELTDRTVQPVDTPFGGPVSVTTGRWRGADVCFIPRHGSDHSIPPHGINYRANIAALKTIGARSVVATAVSGGINADMPPGAMVLISDFLNFTSGRETTFFDGSGRPITFPSDEAGGEPGEDQGGEGADKAVESATPIKVVHTDMSAPYDPALRAVILRAAADEAVPLIHGAVYCTTDGPRFETPAEIRMMRTLGGDLVGMTGYPEVALAVEAGLPYASIGLVSNVAAGMADEPLSVDDIVSLIETAAEPLYRLIGRTVELSGELRP
ncbi:MAG: MTAP family purine nucleoside phosphorylase [Actinomycetota bacterium]